MHEANTVQTIIDIGIVLGEYLKLYSKFMGYANDEVAPTFEDLPKIMSNIEDISNYINPLIKQRVTSLGMIYPITSEKGRIKPLYIFRYALNALETSASFYYSRTDTNYYGSIVDMRTNMQQIIVKGIVGSVLSFQYFPYIDMPSEPISHFDKYYAQLYNSLSNFAGKLKDVTGTAMALDPYDLVEIVNNVEPKVSSNKASKYGILLLSPIQIPLWGQLTQYTVYPNKYSVELTQVEMHFYSYYGGEL